MFFVDIKLWLWNFFVTNSTRKHEEGVIIPSKQLYNAIIPERFREQKIQVVMLPPECRKAKPTELFQVISRRCKKNTSFLQMNPESVPATFREVTQQHFLVCAKCELQAAIFKTSARPIKWQEQFKEGECLKT